MTGSLLFLNESRLNLAAKAWPFPALPPINLLARFHLEVEVRPGKTLQTSCNGSDLVGVKLGPTAKFNNDLVNGGLSHPIFRKVGQCSQSLAREKKRQPTITMLDDAPRSTLQIVECRSIMPAWALLAQASKIIQIIADEWRILVLPDDKTPDIVLGAIDEMAEYLLFAPFFRPGFPRIGIVGNRFEARRVDMNDLVEMVYSGLHGF